MPGFAEDDRLTVGDCCKSGCLFSGLKRRATLFCVAGVALREIPMCLINCGKFFFGQVIQSWKALRRYVCFFMAGATLWRYPCRFFLADTALWTRGVAWLLRITLGVWRQAVATLWPAYYMERASFFAHSRPRSPHCTPYTPYSRLRTLHSRLSILASTFYTSHSMPCTAPVHGLDQCDCPKKPTTFISGFLEQIQGYSLIYRRIWIDGR